MLERAHDSNVQTVEGTEGDLISSVSFSSSQAEEVTLAVLIVTLGPGTDRELCQGWHVGLQQGIVLRACSWEVHNLVVSR